MSATFFQNARLLDPASGRDETGNLRVEAGVIAGLGPDVGARKGDAVVDCGGHLLAPGLIDMLAFVGEPGMEHKETLASLGEAAAAGGVTSVVVMPNTDPVLDEVALIQYLGRRARDTSIVNIHPMAAITQETGGERMTEMGLLKEAGAVAFTDGRKAVANPVVMLRAMRYASAFDLLIVQHPEDPLLAKDGCMTDGELAMRLGLPGMPVEAETILIERDLRLAAAAGCRYHVSQISAAQSIEAVRTAKKHNRKISCGTAAHHFALNEQAVGHYRTFAKTSPPLRSEDDRRAVVDALADGTIDVIVSGHDPQDEESKRLPFAEAAFGTIGLETLLPLALELYHKGEISLQKVWKAMTARPAELLGLDAGRLQEGRPADLVLIDLARPVQVMKQDFRSKSKNSAFDGRPTQGRVLLTMVGGETVFRYE